MSDQRRSCLGKRPYLSEAEAARTARDIKKRGKMAAFTGLEPYKCRWCDHWHLGHGRKRK
jgi:hypothetical protein